ncbi:MAG: FecR domain-containing protein [Planctomycetota bacterium]|nr:FecR domain-containing protein [Planctomycetota bacterium]
MITDDMNADAMNSDAADRLRNWADDYVAGALSPTDREALERELQASDEARRFFVSYLELHAGLAWQFRGADCELPVASETGLGEMNPSETPPTSVAVSAPPPWSWRFSSTAAVVTAAMLAAVMVAWFGLREVPRDPAVNAEPVFAVVRETLRGSWSDGREVRVSESVGKGPWGIENGLVSLVTDDGVELLVEGPARAEWLGEQCLRLTSGSVVVRMPKGQSGFVVELPQMRVTDLGTEFGTSVATNGESRVQVFEGQVRAESLSVPGQKELQAGETLLCTADGTLMPEISNEARFVRRFPPRAPSDQLGGVLYSQSHVDAVRISPPAAPVVIDADLSEWNRENAFRSACLPPYDGSYFVEGIMMYDAQHLYIAAHVGDPEPMRNVVSDAMEFAGGSVIVRVSTDRKLGWPLKGTMTNANSKDPMKLPLPDSLSDRVVSLILSHDARTGEPRIRLQYGFNFRGNESPPSGWRGAFRKDADGRGYSLEYAIPWRLLQCENDPPRAGDVMAALWTVHWSDTDGRLCRGQLVEVTNPQARSKPGVTPATFFADGATWGRAVYLQSK